MRQSAILYHIAGDYAAARGALADPGLDRDGTEGSSTAPMRFTRDTGMWRGEHSGTVLCGAACSFPSIPWELFTAAQRGFHRDSDGRASSIHRLRCQMKRTFLHW